MVGTITVWLNGVKNEVLGAKFGFAGVKSAVTSTLPPGLSQASVDCATLHGKVRYELVSGFLGVTQDELTGTIAPAIGWAVRDGSQLAPQLERLHQSADTGCYVRLRRVHSTL